MPAKERLTQTWNALVTRVFRCPGWARPKHQWDRWGWHDAAFWLIAVSLLAGWYFFLCRPVRQRQELLREQLVTLTAALRMEQAELVRMQREIQGLRENQPGAWERAARSQLGWLKPGEVLDLADWRREQIRLGKPDPFAGPPPRPNEAPSLVVAPPSNAPPSRPAPRPVRPSVAERRPAPPADDPSGPATPASRIQFWP